MTGLVQMTQWHVSQLSDIVRVAGSLQKASNHKQTRWGPQSLGLPALSRDLGTLQEQQV